MPLSLANLREDEERYLRGNVYDLQLLGKDSGSASRFVANLLWRAFLLGGVAWLVFCFALAGCVVVDKWLAALCFLVASVLFAWRLALILVFAFCTYVSSWYEPAFRKPVIYWSWWPLTGFLMVFVGGLLGLMLGHYLWVENFEPYHDLATLQVYDSIDPAIVPGQELQDAGLVSFTHAVDLDRSKGGCFVGGGHTYCIAPIVHGGHVLNDLNGAPLTGSYDFFAVGVDCCTCPNNDFRCGQWQNPRARGGIRSLSHDVRPFFRLAVEDWRAAYRKQVGHPLFFEWVERPSALWKHLYLWARTVASIAVVVSFCVAVAAGIFFGKILQALITFEVASPQDTPMPPPAFQRLWMFCFPEMSNRAKEEYIQLLGMPKSQIPFYSPPGHWLGRQATQKWGNPSLIVAPEYPSMSARDIVL